jgi:anti-anti-sigma factor
VAKDAGNFRDMKIDVHERGDVCLLVLEGEVKLGEPTRLLREKSRELVHAGKRFFVLDMLGVPWLDSSGIGEVFACYKRARQNDGVVKLVLRDRSLSLFTMTQLDRVFEIYGDVDRAVASFDGAA